MSPPSLATTRLARAVFGIARARQRNTAVEGISEGAELETTTGRLARDQQRHPRPVAQRWHPVRTDRDERRRHLVADIIVERKAVNDLALSVVQGRLFGQAEAVCATGHRPWLLIEGDMRQVRSQ